MTYCLNPNCSQPKNDPTALICASCGSKLLLHDRYQTLGILAKGGFGTTFVSSDLSLPGKPLCVVKQLRPSTDDPNVFAMARELFDREAETLAKLGVHPQIPRLLDYFEDNQQFYLVQEYVKGHNLHQEVKKRGPFSEAGVKQFLSELLPILQYVHERKVIHRDIKPANLIRRQTDRKLVLIDFGAVKNQVNTVIANADSQTALTNFAVGTQGFAPPEQMAMRPVYASDIYAVGVTCLYLLTGKSPKAIEVDVNTGELLWEKLVQVSPQFAKVLKRMLEVSVRHRYKSAQEVMDALDMTAYADSLAQSLIAAPVGTPLKPPEDSSPMGNFSVSAPLNSKFRPKNKNREASPNNMLDGQMALQIINTNVLSRGQARSSTDITLLKKKRRLDEKAILDAYNNGRRNFAQEELPNLNLAKAKLLGVNFCQSKLTGANLQGADLSKADLGRANLSQAILKSTNLNNAYLGYADLEGADLRGANLIGANLRYAHLKNANLCGANLSDAQVTPEQIALAKTNWLTVMPNGKRSSW
ncbi:serine/threonine-protein kinase B [Microcystis aeruginosa NIES-2519]|uniref:Serine/threonine-protein kinase B n=1 Tax=Microcystis aeruginosa NIES-2519 TaxID=2303981 RepID=A0A5A5R981_MICAE|nr:MULTISPECIES: serine/threonine-protein kinase [Microcystis]GCA69772.1 serine/threonine-protein kinase B [Microcystis aeruginosa NIES-2519]GCA85181.1 serine/threonine-protein kinase B [Microcystis aeruginosa NIES-2522]CCI30876.1 Serine/threonine-protein kinase B [Microcystis sp. T1-4]